jgi:competence protein ComEC
VVISLLPLPGSLRAAALLWLVPLAAAGRSAPVQGAAEINILDVGEGTSIVVQTAHHVLVYDTGDGYGTDGRTAESVLVPFLRSRGVRRVDVLVASQLTPLRSAGIAALLAEMPVTETLVGGRAPADFNGARACRSAGSWRWDGIVFRVLRPDASVSGTDGTDVCVLLVESEGVRVLLPGDIDARAERGLASANDLSAHIVVVPRHGSDSASTSDFIGAVGARWAVVSGRRARDTHEKPAVVRWRDAGATVLATADIGAIRFRIGPREAIEGPQGQRMRGSSLQSGSLWRSSP